MVNVHTALMEPSIITYSSGMCEQVSEGGSTSTKILESGSEIFLDSGIRGYQISQFVPKMASNSTFGVQKLEF